MMSALLYDHCLLIKNLKQITVKNIWADSNHWRTNLKPENLIVKLNFGVSFVINSKDEYFCNFRLRKFIFMIIFKVFISSDYFCSVRNPVIFFFFRNLWFFSSSSCCIPCILACWFVQDLYLTQVQMYMRFYKIN